MLSQWERWVFVYDLTLKMYPDIAPPVPLDSLMLALKERVDSGLAVERIEGEKKVLRIRDMMIDMKARVACLLINYADPDVPDTVYENLKTGAQREIRKKRDEGGSYCAHLMIELDAIQPGGCSYIALLEDVPGVGKTKIEPFLTKQFKAIAESAPHEFTFTDPNNAERSCRPIADISGYMSQKLRDDLERGEVRGFELVRRRPAEVDYDELGYTKEVAHTVRLSLNQSLGDRALEVIRAVARRAREDDYDGVRVKFKREEGKERTIHVAAGREDVGDVLYTRYELIKGFEIPMKQATESLRGDMLKKMHDLLCLIRCREGSLEIVDADEIAESAQSLVAE